MVRWLSAPSTIHFRPRCEIFVLVVCLHCFNFVNIPPPSKINMELRWVNNVNLFKLYGYFQCFHNLITTLKLMTVFDNTTYQQWFRKKISLWVSNAQSVYQASVTTVTRIPQGDWRTVHCYLHVKNSQTETTAHLLTSKWANTSKVTFHAKKCFHRHDTPWLTNACVRGHSALTSKSLGQHQHDDVSSAK